MALLIPLVVGGSAIAVTIIIHGLAVETTVRFVHRERVLGRAGKHFWVDFPIVVLVISFALAAHLVEMAIWAVLFMVCGEFQVFGTAFYHSAVNYTTLGYGNVGMSPSWRLLSPLEAVDGMLMFGVSTAMIFTVIQRLLESRYLRLRS
jgi:Ion channel